MSFRFQALLWISALAGLLTSCSAARLTEAASATDAFDITSPMVQSYLKRRFGPNYEIAWAHHQGAVRELEDSRLESDLDRWERFAALDAAFYTWLVEEEKSIGDPDRNQLEAFLLSHPTAAPREDSIELQSVFLRRFATESESSHRERVDAVQQDLDSGEDFSQVARRHSDANSRSVGGNAGTITPGSIAPDLEALLFAQPEGEVLGPEVRGMGTYFFRINEKTTEFSFDDPAAVKKLAGKWKQLELGGRVDALMEAFTSNHTIELVPFPQEDEDQRLGAQPWMKEGDTVHFDYYDLYLRVISRDHLAIEEREWGPYWETESLFAHRDLMSRLAAEADLANRNCTLSEEILELERTIGRGALAMNRYYITMELTEEELAAERAKLAAVDPLTKPSYTGTVWSWDPFAELVEAPRGPERGEILTAALDQVYEVLQGFGPVEDKARVDALLDTLNETFTGAIRKPFNEVEFLGPFTDPILQRLEPGEASLPYENQGRLEVLVLTEKGETPRSEEEIQARIESQGKQEHFRQLLTSWQ